MKNKKIRVKTFFVLLVCITIGRMLGNITLVNADLMKGFSTTAYYCIYNSEMDGTQTVTKTISGNNYTLKASFLFGGYGVAMQGTGRTSSTGDYIHYDGGGGSFVSIDNPIEDAAVRERYENLGITDFTGFGNIGLEYPSQATYSVVSGVTGASGRTLIAWYSIAVDPGEIPLGTTGTLIFKTGTTPGGATQMSFRADDTGGKIVGKRIDVYAGEGEASIQEWYDSGGNRIVDVQLPQFNIDVKPSSDTVVRGGSAYATVSISSKGGYSKTVSLSGSGQPSGTTIDFSPSSGTPDFTSGMTISVSDTVVPSTYTITITGTGTDSKTNSTTYTPTVESADLPEFPFGPDLALASAFSVLVMIFFWKRLRNSSSPKHEQQKSAPSNCNSRFLDEFVRAHFL